jgi:L-alanine-DL-glutamate epimerase-like enolase superfamily enzyme
VKQPIWRLFGGSGRTVETDVTISVNDPEEMAEDSRRALKDGFRIIKTKVGIDPGIDFLRLKAIRDAVGSGVKIRIDANQGWKPNEAVRILNRMQDAGFDLELVEQPVKAGDLDGLAHVTANSPVPVAADESCWSARDAMEILRRRAADMVNIKLMKCGGIRNARQIIALSQAMGAEVMIGCMLEGKVSCAAAVHLASAYSCITRVDLDGPVLCSTDPVKGGPIFDGGPKILLTEDPGFGVEEISGLQWSN